MEKNSILDDHSESIRALMKSIGERLDSMMNGDDGKPIRDAPTKTAEIIETGEPNKVRFRRWPPPEDDENAMECYRCKRAFTPIVGQVPLFYCDKCIKESNKEIEGAKKKMFNDTVNSPSHYTWLPGIECTKISRWFSCNVGQAIQYIYRHGHKGSAVEDLRKAVKFLEFEIEFLTEKEKGDVEL